MLLQEILEHNEHFVANKEYVPYQATKFPSKRMVILTCMDTRLVELIPQSLNVHNGEAIILKNAGGIITHPFGSIMRSMVVAIHELQAEEIFVIGHHHCGMNNVNPKEILQKMVGNKVASKDTLSTLEYAGINLQQWLQGFEDVNDMVQKNIDMINNHPLIPETVPVHGLVIDPDTGKLDLLVDGYTN